jgi:hypothetical protein
VGPPAHQGSRWCASHLAAGTSQPGKTQPPSRWISAALIAGVTSRDSFPTSRTSERVPSTKGISPASQHSRRNSPAERSSPSPARSDCLRPELVVVQLHQHAGSRPAAGLAARLRRPQQRHESIRAPLLRRQRLREGIPGLDGGSAQRLAVGVDERHEPLTLQPGQRAVEPDRGALGEEPEGPLSVGPLDLPLQPSLLHVPRAVGHNLFQHPTGRLRQRVGVELPRQLHQDLFGGRLLGRVQLRRQAVEHLADGARLSRPDSSGNRGLADRLVPAQ